MTAGLAGKHMGRSPKLSAKQVGDIRVRATNGESKVVLAAEFGVNRATVYSALKAQPANR